ncbi:hypothetical protein HHI36_013871 [Cryptolaemus montrouzieri]|uniref:Uncharacterized protein n=1 Tax=Cryptolaemus montrouzieri TaxID=559131 RepID=A0ABD2N147_9CUCU
MSTAASAGMQAALLIREKQRLRRKNRIKRGGRLELPSHVATREIGPFPQYPPGFMMSLFYPFYNLGRPKIFGTYLVHSRSNSPPCFTCFFSAQCSQGRAAWQERERGRRCSISEEARQHRIKQTEAHHRWMKRNRIHDTTYGGGSDEEDFFSVYHQSAAANALLYVGLGTTAIGSVIFFVGTGEKGFKTLELRLIGPTLIACGILCCLIRVLLCACPSTCFRKRGKTRLKNTCPHSSSRYPLAPKLKRDHPDYIQIKQNTLPMKHKKQVSIVPPNHSLPSTSTSEFKEFPKLLPSKEESGKTNTIPEIQLPPDFETALAQSQITAHGGSVSSLSEWHQRQEQLASRGRCDSIIELENLELSYEVESVSSIDSESVTIVEAEVKQSTTKLNRKREPLNAKSSDSKETSLSVVIERSDNSEGSDDRKETIKKIDGADKQPAHSGIVLSPLQLGQ